MLQGIGVQSWLAPRDREAPSGVAIDDQTLLRRLGHADPTALEALYQRHAAALFGYLLTICSDRTVAEEVLQDTLLAVWRAAGSFRGRSSVRTWLFAIARRQVRDRNRRQRLPMVEDEQRLTAVDPAPGPEQIAVNQGELRDLVAGINELTVAHREVLALIFVHELSYHEAAQVLEVPVGTVKSRLNAARQTLQQRRKRRKETVS
ncbi:MAG TPA: sigma-70 family RNA polymerase sigma factor [Chloroflexota bacterium]